MSAPTMADFRQLVAEAFDELDAYQSDAAWHDERMLIHDIAMGRPLARLEWPIRRFAARYCALDREDDASPWHPKRGPGRPVKRALRDTYIRALFVAARENDIEDEDSRSAIAARVGLTVGSVRRITNRSDP